MKPSKSDPLNKAAIRQVVIDLLSRRDYSRQELIRKLQPKVADESELFQVLDDFAANKWQSDERFTESFISGRTSRYGPMRLAQELRNRGISEADARAALVESDTDWKAQALDIVKRKFGQEDLTDLKQKARAYRFMAQRGFSAEQIQYALRMCNVDEFGD